MSTKRSHSPSTKVHSKRSGSLSKSKLEARTNDLLRSVRDLEARIVQLERLVNNLNQIRQFPRPYVPHHIVLGD